jgi:hypothetical protein
MKQNKAYRAVEPEDLAILLLPVGEFGAMILSAGSHVSPGLALRWRNLNLA